MSSVVDWTKFLNLPGSPNINFELLCRGIIRLNFGAYGEFVSRANMPGIEFYLNIHTSHPALGDESKCIGWQCKWYDIQAGASIGTTRKNEIKKGICKTEQYFPEVTDWVLWTKNTLCKQDQEWFDELKKSTNLTLHLYDSEDVHNLSSGAALLFASTYFGDFALDEVSLRDLHRISVTRIEHRWNPNIHQVVKAENLVLRSMGRSPLTKSLGELIKEFDLSINYFSDKIVDLSSSDSCDLFDSLSIVLSELIKYSTFLKEFFENARSSHVAKIRTMHFNFDLSRDEYRLPKRFAKRGFILGAYLKNLFALVGDSCQLIDSIKESLQKDIAIISGRAGDGKTELLLNLAKGDGINLPGLILHASQMGRNGSLVDLVANLSVGSRRFDTFETLLCALNSVGERVGQRILLGIDGLNESEDPRVWHHLLSELRAYLCKYPYVFAVCSIRPAFVEEAIPEGISIYETEGFGKYIQVAIDKYFEYYKIKKTSHTIPLEILNTPLFLKIFCEVTNPKREQETFISDGPGSLMALFEKYVESSVKRICELSHFEHRIYPMDIKGALGVFADSILESNSRDVLLDLYKEKIGDDRRQWNFSFLHAMEDGGLLLRVKKADQSVGVESIYDAFSGYLIANQLVQGINRNSIKDWINSEEIKKLLFGDYNDGHTLAEDILAIIVPLISQRFYGCSLWEFVDNDLAQKAILECSFDLEISYLNHTTVCELKKYMLSTKPSRSTWFRLFRLRHNKSHPLNVNFLNDVLMEMSVGYRDATWSLWIESNAELFISFLKRTIERWESQSPIGHEDSSDCSALIWLLVSPNREIRDLATKALFLYGVKDKAKVFSLSIYSLNINDQYVAMRLFGIVHSLITTNHFMTSEDKTVINSFIRDIDCRSFEGNTLSPMNNYLIKKYIKSISDFLLKNNILEGEGIQLLEARDGITLIDEGNIDSDRLNRALGMDFENYTLGRLFDDRRNYDNSHKGHKRCVSYVKGVIKELGWLENDLSKIDDNRDSYSNRHEKARVERFGKKYSWIAFYNYAGILDNKGELSLRYSSIEDDIDCSFITKAEQLMSNILPRCIEESQKPQEWIEGGKVKFPRKLFVQREINNNDGEWILVSGYLSCQSQDESRRLWGFFNGVSVKSDEAVKEMLKIFRSVRYRELVDNRSAEIHSVLSGEIPYGKDFVAANNDYKDFFKRSFSSLNGGKGYNLNSFDMEYSFDRTADWLDVATRANLPSLEFINKTRIKRKYGTLNFFDEEGRLATLSMKAPSGTQGNLFYIRKDILMKFLEDDKFVCLAWGERETSSLYSNMQNWELKARQEDKNVWKQTFKLK